jgi:E3 ubiquitin-protein ligase RNF115/126
MVMRPPMLGSDPREYVFSDTAFQGLLERLMGEGHCLEGMSDPALAALRRERNSEGECIICQEQYQLDDETIRLDCGHLFHSGCVVPWLKRVASCPVCRFNMLKKE